MRTAFVSLRAVAVLVLAGLAHGADADGGEELLDSLGHPSPERREAALRALRELDAATLFPLLVRHREDERPVVRRTAHVLCLETLLHGTDARRTALLECLWEEPDAGRALLPALETWVHRFPSRGGRFALAVAMRVRRDRAHVRRLAEDPASWPLLARFDPARWQALAAFAWVRARPRTAPPDAVAPFEREGRGGLEPSLDALAAASPELDGLLADVIRDADAHGLALRIALAGTVPDPLPKTGRAVTSRLRDGDPDVLRSVARGLLGGGPLDPERESVARARLEDGTLDDAARAAVVVAGTRPEPSDAWRALLAVEAEGTGLSAITARLLGARDGAERMAAARRIWSGAPEGRPRLRMLYELTRLGSPCVVPVIVHALRAGGRDERILLLEQLRGVPRSAELATALLDVREALPVSTAPQWCDRLAWLDPDLAVPGAADALVAALSSGDSALRGAAVESCQWLRRYPEPVVAALTEAVPREAVRPLLRVVESAMARGTTAADLLPFLLAVVEDRGSAAGRSAMRQDALFALARIAPDDARVRAAFLAGLDSPAVDMRATAAFCLRAVGSLTADEQEALALQARSDPSQSVRTVATRVLAWHEQPLEQVR